MTATTRRLTSRDALAYRALMLDAYARHPDAFTSSVDERATLPMAWWEKRLGAEDADSSIVFAAFHGDRMVGVAGLSFEPRSKARHKASLFGMYVPAAFRGCGIGRALVATVLDHARGRPGIMLVQLTVTYGNAAARALYERFGFVAFGVEPFAVAVDGRYVSKVHMWRNLADPIEGRLMLKAPDNSDLPAWHLYFAKVANNRAWQLSVESRDAAGDREMLDAAHASAWHWQVVGTEIHRMRSAMLLAEVHAALGHGDIAMRHARTVRDYFLGKPDTPDWEIAFTHLVYAHAAHAAGDAAAHRRAYEEAVRAVDAIAEGEDRDIVLASLRQVPAP